MTDTSSQISARLALPYVQPAQAQKHVTVNEALQRLDLLVQLTVEAFDATTPPAVLSEGQVWALGPSPSGEWVGQGNMLAARVGNGWLFIAPVEGWRACLRPTGGLYIWSGGAWVSGATPDLNNLTGIGVNASADATNRIISAAKATLLTHEGAGHQLKINKATATDTASLLFQTGWSGRAELGTAGSDDLSFKVSPNGTDWQDALRLSGATGQVVCPNGLVADGPLTGSAVTQTSTDPTPGRIMKTGDFGLGFSQVDSGLSVNGLYLGAPEIVENDILLLCKATAPGTALRGQIVSNQGLDTASADVSGYRAMVDYVVAQNGTRRCNFELARMDGAIGLQLVQFRLGGTEYIGLRNTSPAPDAPLRLGHLRFTGTMTPEPLAFSRVAAGDLDLWNPVSDTAYGAIYASLSQGDPVVDGYGKNTDWQDHRHLMNDAEILTRRNAIGPVASMPDSDGTWLGAVMSDIITTPNCSYIRLANGVQICWAITAASYTIQTTAGALFTSGPVAQDFPASFSHPPSCTVTAEGGATCWGSVQAGLHQWQGQLWGPVSDATPRQVRMLAVGRWF